MNNPVPSENNIKPRFCVVSVVYRCNFRCKMCHIWEQKNGWEISIGQWKDFLVSFRKIADKNCQVNFAGGEPFLNENLPELIKFAQEMRFLTAVPTNAYFVDEAMAVRIGESRLDTIALSLDSLDGAKHDYLRVPGSYERVMKAVSFLSKHAPQTKINLLTIIMEANLDDIIPLLKWAESASRINMITLLALVQPRGRKKDNQWYKDPQYGCIWPQNEYRLNKIIDEIAHMKNNGLTKLGNPLSQLLCFKKYYKNPNDGIHNHATCNMGYNFLGISEKGDVMLCEESESIGNILQEDIRSLWVSERANKFRAAMADCGKNCHQLINCCYTEE